MPLITYKKSFFAISVIRSGSAGVEDSTILVIFFQISHLMEMLVAEFHIDFHTFSFNIETTVLFKLKKSLFKSKN